MLHKLWELFERIVRAVVGALLKLIGRELSDKQWQGFMQFVRFCLVGVSNTLISYGIYYIFVAVKPELYLIGYTAGFVASVLNAYFWNSRYVFKKKDEKAKTMAKTFLAYGTNLFIGGGLLFLMVDVIHIHEMIAPLLNLAVTVPLNFLLNKFWVMR